MSDQDNYRDIPELGPARDELDEVSPRQERPPQAAEERRSTPAAKASHRSHKGLVFGLFFSLGALAGVAGWGYTELQRLQAEVGHARALQQNQQAALEHALSQLPVLEGLVSSTDENLLKSGQALRAQVDEMAKVGAEWRKKVDTELTALNSAGKETEPRLAAAVKRLDEQGDRLAQQSARLETQTARLQQQQALIEEQDKRVGQLVEARQSRETANAGKLDELAGQVQTLKADLGRTRSALEQQTRSQGTLEGRVAEVTKGLAQLERRSGDLAGELQALEGKVAQAQSAPAISGLDKRLLDIEQAIDAFDGSRRQLNQELLQVKRRLNHLQLSLEQRAVAP